MVNSIVGGQVILEVSDRKVPLAVGVILIAIISPFVASFGYTKSFTNTNVTVGC
jgi:purine-cytosine permease-like protein